MIVIGQVKGWKIIGQVKKKKMFEKSLVKDFGLRVDYYKIASSYKVLDSIKAQSNNRMAYNCFKVV